ncbi:MCE family protein [Dietzia maris]|uniref:MCE family protein n=2 Tax=Dietzia TaxID=37914 RepID=UPI00300265E6
MTGRRAVGAALLVVSTTTMSGCDWKGLNSLPLPGTAGGGPDGYSVTVQLADATTLDRNARVRVGDVTVGRIADIGLGPGFAEVTIDLDGEVRLPRNATARVGQSSLLGASHLELSAPPGEPAEGTLSDGDLVPVERSGGYPTTEQTLATLAAALGGSGLAQAAEVFGELDVAMTGRTDEVRAVVGRLSELLTGLEAQKEDIVEALEALEGLSTELAVRSDEVEGGVADLGPALQVLAQRRQRLVEATRAVDTVTATAGRVVEASGGDLRAGLESLDPVLQGLADSGDSLTESPRYLATFPFPLDTYRNAVRGDYANGTVILDLRLPVLDTALLIGTPFEGSLASLDTILGVPAPPVEPARDGLGDVLAPPPPPPPQSPPHPAPPSPEAAPAPAGEAGA